MVASYDLLGGGHYFALNEAPAEILVRQSARYEIVVLKNRSFKKLRRSLRKFEIKFF